MLPRAALAPLTTAWLSEASPVAPVSLIKAPAIKALEPFDTSARLPDALPVAPTPLTTPPMSRAAEPAFIYALLSVTSPAATSFCPPTATPDTVAPLASMVSSLPVTLPPLRTRPPYAFPVIPALFLRNTLFVSAPAPPRPPVTTPAKEMPPTVAVLPDAAPLTL